MTALSRVRQRLLPLGRDSIAPLDLPPVRMGLLAKLNLLTVGLIFLTAVSITAFLFSQQQRSAEAQLQGEGAGLLATLSEVAKYAIYAFDKVYVEQVVAALAANPNVAYVEVIDADRQRIAERRFVPELAKQPLPEFSADARVSSPSTIDRREYAIGNSRYLELIAAVTAPEGAALRESIAGVAPKVKPLSTIGYIRLGMTFEPQRRLFREQMAGALAVVLVLVVVTILVTLVLTRRLVAPMRRLMRAARLVGSGRLDIYVPARSSDELGLLTHTFNHMTQKLAQAQAEVDHHQRTLQEKVAQRTRELEIATAHAYRLAQHDILTGLPNRSLLNLRLKQILAQAHRDKTLVACLFLDFDHFKRINDTLGHDAGDHLLQAIAQRLSSAVRESDTVARLGGDEFVLVVSGLAAADAVFEVMAVLTRVRESFLAPFRLGDQMPTLTCSVGIAMYPGEALDGVALIKQADTAMYAAKEAGRNAYKFYTADMNARVQLRLQLETDMQRGLMDDEFFLVYQPQIEMRTGRACGVEALLRWRDPKRGVISPNEFIPIAEESGMIQALGARVLRDACQQVVQWHRDNMPLRLSVNLSVQQLQHESWLSIVQEALSASGLPPQYLDLEITESIIITHPEKAVATLVRLKQMGVSITVDDFGTGYSSLSYLARLPIQAIKVDQRFVRGLEKNRNDRTITQAIVALSNSLGLRCIAEGVETQAQFDFLLAAKCEEAQGYLISRPLAHADVRAWWLLQQEVQHGRHQQGDLWQRAARQ